MKKLISSKAGLRKVIVDVAMKTAVKSANSTCLWFQYQPKMPAALRKYKK